jgi:2-aminoadipate transaminase
MDASSLQRFLSDSARGAKRSEIRELLKVIAQPNMISLAGGLPAPATFPVKTIGAVIDQVLEEQGATALQYGPTEGDLGLREELVKFALEEGHRDVDSDHILVTSASQQALDLCSRIFLAPGDAVVCGLPSYLGALGAFTACGARLCGVPLDDDGMRPDLLEDRLISLRRDGVRPKFLYLVPDFQNPAGVTIPGARRAELLSIAREFDLLLIEDNPYRRLRYAGEEQPTFGSLDRDGRVISLYSFSKVFCPGFRLGWVVASPSIISTLTVAKQPVDLCTSSFTQCVAREYLHGGHLESRVERTKAIYAEKREVMLAALDEHMDPAWGVHWTRPEGGMFLWLTLPEPLLASDLFERALRKKVAFVVGSAFYCDGGGPGTVRLNFSYPSHEELRSAVERLASAISEMVAESRPARLAAATVDSSGPILHAGDHALDHLALNLALHEILE